MSNAIKVAFFGMDERSADRMRTVFRMVYKEQCVSCDMSEADVALIDMDDKNPQDTWDMFRSKHPQVPAIIMSKDPVSIPDVPVVPKPAKLPELFELLKKQSGIELVNSLKAASQAATSRAAQSLEKRGGNTTKAQTNQTGEIYYQPENFLQGKVLTALNEAKKNNKTAFIHCWSDRWIVIYPESRLVLENLKDTHLRSLGLVQVSDEVVYKVTGFGEEELRVLADSPASEVKAKSFEKFIWDLTVRTARGRVPEGTDLNEPCYLDRWPNLTRLAKIPSALRITAFWVGNPQSLNNIAAKLAIPLSHVLTFYSAAAAIGYAGQAKRKEDTVITPEVQVVHEKKRGLFAALMRRLGNKYDTEIEEAENEDVA